LDAAQERRIEALPEIRIRVFEQRDLRYLKTIARNGYSGTRFFYDPHFRRSLAKNLYVTWIEKSCQGEADAVLVLEMHQKPTGYITCHILQEEVGQIGLVGLDAKVRGMGVGKQLVYSALRQFQQWGMKRVEVVTQGRNLKAQRLYQSCGFVTRNLQLWYHKWLNG
jgi:ribosomal protein S18 acetylase RimI-like enzyme